MTEKLRNKNLMLLVRDVIILDDDVRDNLLCFIENLILNDSESMKYSFNIIAESVYETSNNILHKVDRTVYLKDILKIFKNNKTNIETIDMLLKNDNLEKELEIFNQFVK